MSGAREGVLEVTKKLSANAFSERLRSLRGGDRVTLQLFSSNRGEGGGPS